MFIEARLHLMARPVLAWGRSPIGRQRAHPLSPIGPPTRDFGITKRQVLLPASFISAQQRIPGPYGMSRTPIPTLCSSRYRPEVCQQGRFRNLHQSAAASSFAAIDTRFTFNAGARFTNECKREGCCRLGQPGNLFLIWSKGQLSMNVLKRKSTWKGPRP